MKSKDSPDNLELIRKSIRDRIVPAAAMVDDRTIPETESVTQLESNYEEDLEKLRTLTKNQLKGLLDRIEEKSREGTGLFSRGDLLNGLLLIEKL